MESPGNLSTARLTARNGPWAAITRSIMRAILGFDAADFEAGDVNERAMRRIRAKQVEAITRLVPVTMTVNVANAAIVLCAFWNTGSNLFLAGWALAVGSAAAVAIRSWLRSR